MQKNFLPRAFTAETFCWQLQKRLMSYRLQRARFIILMHIYIRIA